VSDRARKSVERPVQLENGSVTVRPDGGCEMVSTFPPPPDRRQAREELLELGQLISSHVVLPAGKIRVLVGTLPTRHDLPVCLGAMTEVLWPWAS
jgi:hypothetical protein